MQRGRKFLPIVYRSKEAKEYKDVITKLLTGTVKQLVGDLSVQLRFFRPRRVGDLDNRHKVLFDVLQGIAYKDDKQIKRMASERFDDKTNPRVELRLREIKCKKP